MKSRWEEAILVNRAILSEFPNDMEAYNRLGKGLSELGQNQAAIEAFEAALRISPHNSIARKNLNRLMQLSTAPGKKPSGSTSVKPGFATDSGKSAMTSLVNISSSGMLLKMDPGQVVKLEIDGKMLRASLDSGEQVGQVEPKLASRLIRLMNRGNRYDAEVIRVNQGELIIQIREVYKHPSQASIVSFPRGTGVRRIQVPNAIVDYDLVDPEQDEAATAMIKDWSSDDTEPGDDEAFAPVYHRIINSSGDDDDNDERNDY